MTWSLIRQPRETPSTAGSSWARRLSAVRRVRCAPLNELIPDLSANTLTHGDQLRSVVPEKSNTLAIHTQQ